MADLSSLVGWDKDPKRRADDIALSVVAWGFRNIFVGSLLTVAAAAIWGNMPAKVWAGTLLFGLVIAPSGIAMGRAGVMIDGNLGLWAIHSAGAVAAVGWAWAVFGTVDVGNAWLLVGGSALIAAGSMLAASASQPPANRIPENGPAPANLRRSR